MVVVVIASLVTSPTVVGSVEMSLTVVGSLDTSLTVVVTSGEQTQSPSLPDAVVVMKLDSGKAELVTALGKTVIVVGKAGPAGSS